jgi:membrane protein DedA with SNARE-associated domain
MHWFYHVVRHTLVHWGYWAVLAGLLGEDAGLPFPGYTTLMFASFLSNKHTGLRLQWVVLIGIGACVLGDNLGFYFGHKLGSPLIRWAKKLFHLNDDDVGAARDQLRRHCGATIFFRATSLACAQ